MTDTQLLIQARQYLAGRNFIYQEFTQHHSEPVILFINDYDKDDYILVSSLKRIIK